MGIWNYIAAVRCEVTGAPTDSNLSIIVVIIMFFWVAL